jgi:Bacterial SH3 domain
MTSPYSALALRLCLCLAALVLPAIVTGGLVPWHGSAFAESAGVSEKEAFEAAKSLGTVEAWDAFLSNYPTGFHADLARAYVKKLSDQPQAPSPSPSPAAAPAVSANDDFPAPAGSWGGVVRDGPGRQYRQVDSLKEGEPVTLMGRSDVIEDGYPWFKIISQSGQTGYQWGGILCSTGAERPDLFQHTLPGRQARAGAKVKPRCKNGGEWDGLRCRPAGYFNKPKSDLNNPPRRKKRCPAGQYLPRPARKT